jgi:hypothetical protein
MLAFLFLVNLLDLAAWLEWTLRMQFRSQRSKWVRKKWLDMDEKSLSDAVEKLTKKFSVRSKNV